MKSHTCECGLNELLRLLGRPLLAVGVFAVMMHGGARWRILPAPRPALDSDRTIVIHQAERSRAPADAEVLLIGDSDRKSVV